MKILNELVELANLANESGQGTREMADFRVAANPDNILAIAEAFRALEQRAEAAEAKVCQDPECHSDFMPVYKEMVARGKRIDELEAKLAEREQRAEAAESECTRLDRESQNLSDQLGACDRERRDLRVKLAELEKQEPYLIPHLEHFIAFWQKVSAGNLTPGKNEISHTLWLMESLGEIDLFTRPAPAVSLAELVPDGWKLVPVEPTKRMIINGFESEPDEFFSDADDWAKYDAMSGCQQAAHKARLCWAAMIAASPQPPTGE
jgi:hypothetical protein